MQCANCQSVENLYELPCKHVMCVKCFGITQNTCSVCKTPIPSDVSDLVKVQQFGDPNEEESLRFAHYGERGTVGLKEYDGSVQTFQQGWNDPPPATNSVQQFGMLTVNAQVQEKAIKLKINTNADYLQRLMELVQQHVGKFADAIGVYIDDETQCISIPSFTRDLQEVLNEIAAPDPPVTLAKPVLTTHTTHTASQRSVNFTSAVVSNKQLSYEHAFKSSVGRWACFVGHENGGLYMYFHFSGLDALEKRIARALEMAFLDGVRMNLWGRDGFTGDGSPIELLADLNLGLSSNFRRAVLHLTEKLKIPPLFEVRGNLVDMEMVHELPISLAEKMERLMNPQPHQHGLTNPFLKHRRSLVKLKKYEKYVTQGKYRRYHFAAFIDNQFSAQRFDHRVFTLHKVDVAENFIFIGYFLNLLKLARAQSSVHATSTQKNLGKKLLCVVLKYLLEQGIQHKYWGAGTGQPNPLEVPVYLQSHGTFEPMVDHQNSQEGLDAYYEKLGFRKITKKADVLLTNRAWKDATHQSTLGQLLGTCQTAYPHERYNLGFVQVPNYEDIPDFDDERIEVNRRQASSRRNDKVDAGDTYIDISSDDDDDNEQQSVTEIDPVDVSDTQTEIDPDADPLPPPSGNKRKMEFIAATPPPSKRIESRDDDEEDIVSFLDRRSDARAATEHDALQARFDALTRRRRERTGERPRRRVIQEGEDVADAVRRMRLERMTNTDRRFQ